MKIFTFIQQENGVVNRNALEALVGSQSMAAASGGTVSAIVMGSVPEELSGYNLAEIIQITGQDLDTFKPLAFAAAMSQLIESEKPDIVIFGHTYQVRDWVPRISAGMDIPFIADCIGFKFESTLTMTRQIYQGKINADYGVNGLAIASYQSGSYRTDQIEAGSAQVREFTADLSGVPGSVRPGEKFQESKGTVDLSRAPNILAIGRGVGKEENMEQVNELAAALDAEIGASRPVVDYGWLPHERQVGSSGQTVSPNMYLALGISGAIQHQVGMKGANNIIAVNKDENAPIFEIADFGIVSDMFEILPKLTEAIKAAKYSFFKPFSYGGI